MRPTVLSRLMCAFALLALCGCGSSQNDSNAGTAGSADQAAAQQQAPQAPPIVIKPDTNLRVTIDQTVSSKDSNAGDRVEASLAAPVVADGSVVIPEGAKVSGEVTNAKSAGRFKGGAELGITLTSVVVGGQRYTIHTSTFSEATKGRGERTAVGAGIGAGAGALIGAVAGGGKGAAIGAGAGGGAGLAGAALTGNREITIAAETKLDFKLARPLEIHQK